MTLKFHSSVIFVKDIHVSKAFYCDVLKQKIETDFGNNVSLKGGLSLWQVPDWHMLSRDFYKKNDSNRSLELYFETEDIYQTVQLINLKGIKKHHELTEESWGQMTIRIYDPDDNLIEIGEKLESFILRMYMEGLSIEDIHKKSGVPLNLIIDYIQQ